MFAEHASSSPPDRSTRAIKSLVSGITAVFRKNLSSKYPPLLCGETNEAVPASQNSYSYHKTFIISHLKKSQTDTANMLYCMKHPFSCKANKKINTVLSFPARNFEKYVLSPVIVWAITKYGNSIFLISKSLGKMDASYNTTINICLAFHPCFHYFKILSSIFLLAFITVMTDMEERYTCVVRKFSCPKPRLTIDKSLPMSLMTVAQVWRAT